MTGARGQSALELLEAARGRADPQVLETLWAAVPEEMRLLRFAPGTVPPQYAGAFCRDGTWRAGVDLSHLPDPMRREVAWCIFRIIGLGGTIPTPGLGMVVRGWARSSPASPGSRPSRCLRCRAKTGVSRSSTRCTGAPGGCPHPPRCATSGRC